MDRKSYRLLKFISRKMEPVKDFEILNLFGDNAQKHVDFLMSQKFIEASIYEIDSSRPYVIGGKHAFEITPLGQSALEETADRSKRFWIPVAISLIALIKSFSQEILSLLRLLVPQLK